MKKWVRILGIILLIILVALIVGPFLFPISLLENVSPVHELALSTSQFMDIHDILIHYEEKGEEDLKERAKNVIRSARDVTDVKKHVITSEKCINELKLINARLGITLANY